jgi:hypothetical protein
MRNNQGQDEHFVGKVEDIAMVLSVAIEGGQNSCPGISKTPQNAPLLQGHSEWLWFIARNFSLKPLS